MTQKQAELDDLVATINPTPSVILEIGVDQGRSFHHWQATWPTADIIGVDLGGARWASGPPLRDTRIIRGDSHDQATQAQVLERLAGRPVDFLFIDADHSFNGIAQDYWAYSRLVRPGGTIAIHDICPHPPELDVHVDDFWHRIRHRHPDAHEIIHPPTDWGGIGVVTQHVGIAA